MGKFAKLAATELASSDASAIEPWEAELKRQEQMLYSKIPSSEEEASSKAIKNIQELHNKSYAVGYMLRYMRRLAEEKKSIFPSNTEGVPGREIALSMPSKKASSIDALLDPMRETAEDIGMRASGGIGEQKSRLMRTTADPSTLPWYYPMMALTAPNALASGFQKAEQDMDAIELARINERLNKAKGEFEQALAEEYSSAPHVKAGGVRTSSAGEIIDGLAKVHIKSAEGELNQVLGAYLSLAALLGQGAHITAKEWAEKRDPNRQKIKLLREAIRQRMRTQMPSIRVESGEPALMSETD
jgi:hypothetical protein